MNKEEKINTLRRLIKSNPICDFGRKKLQTAKLHKIHNDFVYKPKRFILNINKHVYINKIDFIFNLKDKSIYDDLYNCSVKIFQQKLKGNPYIKKTYDSLDVVVLKDKYKQYSDDRIKQLLTASYTICVTIGEYK